jgi:hypothetical protein
MHLLEDMLEEAEEDYLDRLVQLNSISGNLPVDASSAY